MSNQYSDLGDTLAHAISNPVLSAPIPGVATQYVLTQKFMQPKVNFSPLAMNTPFAGDATYVLTEERDFQDMGGGIQTWTREYCKVPSQHLEPSTYVYNFIGYLGTIPNAGVDVSAIATDFIGRNRRYLTTKAKMQCDYFLIDGATYTSPAAIPIIQPTVYYGADGVTLTDWLYNTPPYTAASVPSRTTYAGYITSDAGSETSFSLVAEGSRVERWKGLIMKRTTLYIKAL